MIAALLAALVTAGDSMVVSTAWLAAHARDPDLVILHVAMEREEYDRGHIAGARWVNPHDLMSNTPPGAELPSRQVIDSVLETLGIGDRSRIVYYGDTWMAPRVYLALEAVGLGDRVSLLDGGLPAWRREQRPLSTVAPTWAKGHLTARTDPDVVVDAAWLRAHLADATVALIDARTAGEYSGADHSERLPRSGHIPGAVNLPWEMTFTDGAGALEGTPSPLKSRAELRELLANAGARQGRTLVVYCTVGLRASHLYFVARYLGWPVRLYDASMSEWSRRTELPMATGPGPE